MWRRREDPDRKPARDDEALYASAAAAGRGQPLIVGVTIGVLVVLTVVLVWAQNGQAVDFDWAFFDASVPLWAVAFGGVVVGILAAVGAGLVWREARRRAVVRRSALDRLESRPPPTRSARAA
jgi:uncharacterized integral membrane protein